MGRLRKISSFGGVIFVLTKTAWHSYVAAAVHESDKEWTMSWAWMNFFFVNRLWTCLQVTCSRAYVMLLYTFLSLLRIQPRFPRHPAHSPVTMPIVLFQPRVHDLNVSNYSSQLCSVWFTWIILLLSFSTILPQRNRSCGKLRKY
jgi:hypothetical protein